MGLRSLSRWVVPAGLVALSLVPAVAGSLRLVELGTSGEITPANARFFEHPIATSLHIVSSLLFALLGAFQVSDTIRPSCPRWHRGAGRILVPAGFAMALSGLWLTGVMPAVAYDGPALSAMRMVVGGVILACLALGVRTLVVRDFAAHGAWMLRAYALGLGAGTQVFTHVPWFVFPEIRGETTRAVLMGAGWAVNLVVCEAVLRRRRVFRGTPADLPRSPGDPRHLRDRNPARDGNQALREVRSQPKRSGREGLSGVFGDGFARRTFPPPERDSGTRSP